MSAAPSSGIKSSATSAQSLYLTESRKAFIGQVT
jgi:hypothetical protein